MKKGKLLALLLGTSLALVACGDKEDAATTVTDPQKIFNNSCAQCHGGDLKGRGNAVALDAIGAQYSKEEIETIINDGNGGGMPGGMIKDKEQVSILAEWLAEKK